MYLVNLGEGVYMVDGKKNNDKPEFKEPKADTKTSSKAKSAQEDIESLKGVSAIAYLGILFLVPMLMYPKSKFCMFHANQGLILLVVAAVGYFILTVIPVIGWALTPLWSLFVVILVIMGIVNAVNGRMKPLPIIGGYTLLKTTE